MSNLEKSKSQLIRPGEIFADRYEIVRLLGKGSMGWTVEAYDKDLDDEQVAIKILFPKLLDNPQMVERLSKEIVLTRQLSHPSIVRTFDLDQDPQHGHFITMECVDGWSLKKIIADAYSELSLEFKIKVLQDIAQALAFAHKRGILHRDLRPGNVLVSKLGEVKLCDFSFARVLELDSSLTSTGELIGRPEYMSPEQFLGKELDCQSDIYSFGILAFELLVGKLPFDSSSYLEAAKSHLQKTIPMISEVTKAVPDELSELVHSCTEFEASRRPASGVELLNSISELAKSYSVSDAQIPKTLINKKKTTLTAWGISLSFILVFTSLVYVGINQTGFNRFMAPQVLLFEQYTGIDMSYYKSSIKVEGKLSDPKAPLLALRRGDYRSFEALYLAGADIGTKDELGNTILHEAQNLYTIQYYLGKRDISLPIDVINKKGETPLIVATKNGNLFMTAWIAKSSALLNHLDNTGRGAVHYLVELANKESLEEVASRFNLDLRDSNGNSPLHSAIHFNRLEILEALLRQGANPNIRDRKGRTPLMLLLLRANSFKGVEQGVNSLITAGASLDARDNEGRSVVEYQQQENLNLISFAP